MGWAKIYTLTQWTESEWTRLKKMLRKINEIHLKQALCVRECDPSQWILIEILCEMSTSSISFPSVRLFLPKIGLHRMHDILSGTFTFAALPKQNTSRQRDESRVKNCDEKNICDSRFGTRKATDKKVNWKRQEENTHSVLLPRQFSVWQTQWNITILEVSLFGFLFVSIKLSIFIFKVCWRLFFSLSETKYLLIIAWERILWHSFILYVYFVPSLLTVRASGKCIIKTNEKLKSFIVEIILWDFSFRCRKLRQSKKLQIVTHVYVSFRKLSRNYLHIFTVVFRRHQWRRPIC